MTGGKQGWYAFLDIQDFPTGLFCHNIYGVIWDLAHNTWGEEKDSREPKVGDELYYEIGDDVRSGKKQVVRWAHVPQSFF